MQFTASARDLEDVIKPKYILTIKQA